MRAFALSIAITLAAVSSTFASTITLATVQINDSSAQHAFTTGALVADPATGTGPSTYWHTIPSVLNEGSLQFDFLTVDSNKASAVQYGKLDFTVESTGPVWMLTTTRFGEGGNGSGDWLPEVSTQSQLEANGWNLVLEGVQTETGYNTYGQNSLDNFGWLLFQRSSIAGENFFIRTEKYEAPVILQGTGVALPEPSSMSLFAFAGVLLLMKHARKRCESHAK